MLSANLFCEAANNQVSREICSNNAKFLMQTSSVVDKDGNDDHCRKETVA